MASAARSYSTEEGLCVLYLVNKLCDIIFLDINVNLLSLSPSITVRTVHHVLLIGIGRAGQVDNVTAKLVIITLCSVPGEWRPAPLAWCWVE